MWLLVCFVFLLRTWVLWHSPLWTPLLHLRLNCLLASFRNLGQRRVEGGLWLTERGSFWTQIWLMILKVVQLSPLLWLVIWLPAKTAHTASFFPLPPRRILLILVSSVFNSRVVSGSQSTSRGLVSWRQVSWLFCFPHKTFDCAF